MKRLNAELNAITPRFTKYYLPPIVVIVFILIWFEWLPDPYDSMVIAGLFLTHVTLSIRLFLKKWMRSKTAD